MDKSLNTCTAEDCGKPIFVKMHGLCRRHYRQAAAASLLRRPTMEERFWAKVDKSADACWLWTGAQNGSGYGEMQLSKPRRVVLTHRIAYELLVGPIPDGLRLDHLCRVRHCVNPAHLEPVTDRENILRGVAPSAICAAKTHCINGHEFTPENTLLLSRGERVCRTCKRRKERARRAS